ncbi:hypothetical protein AKJ09_04076 [Labilithrix luteola]|uniref:Type IV fimbrial biogenesis protein PilY1 n=2 Tax=Labilithrix luteola TaxID=1391654 RepID=A0A0K1PV60_9BACT|nr:hypothetical protein AKJ09_04076 [Labilithrix luteola]
MLVASTGVATVFACAGSDEGDPAVTSQPAGPSVPEASVAETGTDAEAPDAKDGAPREERTCSDEGWCQTVVPDGLSLHGVWGDGTGVIWAAADDGSVLRFDQNTWSVHAKLSGPLTSIWGSGPTDIWVAGRDGIYHGTGTSSSALTFEPNEVPGDSSLVISSIWGTGPKDVWAVAGKLLDWQTPVNRVVHYSEGAGGMAAWSLDEASSLPYAFTKVWGTASSGVWIGGSGAPEFMEAAVFRRPVGATNFENVGLPDAPNNPFSGNLGVFETAGTNGEEVWIVGQTAGASREYIYGNSTDGNHTYTWKFISRDDNDQRMEAIWGPAGTGVLAAGDYGRFRRWDGVEWKQVAFMTGLFPIVKPLHDLWGKSASEVWVVGDGVAAHFDPTKAKAK